MLYNNFIACIMTCAFFALITMIDNHDWEYILLPIGILIWGIFKFFDANDRDWLWDRGIDPDEYNAFFPDIYDDKYHRRYQRSNTSYPTRNGNTITWNNSGGTHVEDAFDSNLFGGCNGTHDDYSRYQPKTTRTWNDPRYKGMVDKCKRNFKITVEEKKEEETKSKSVLHSISRRKW